MIAPSVISGLDRMTHGYVSQIDVADNDDIALAAQTCRAFRERFAAIFAKLPPGDQENFGYELARVRQGVRRATFNDAYWRGEVNCFTCSPYYRCPYWTVAEGDALDSFARSL